MGFIYIFTVKQCIGCFKSEFTLMQHLIRLQYCRFIESIDIIIIAVVVSAALYSAVSDAFFSSQTMHE